MGKMITFWSPVAGQAKVTSSVCAIVSSLAIHHSVQDIAVSSVGASDTSLADNLENKTHWSKSKELYERSGVPALILSYKQGFLTKERIRRCALPLVVPSVYLFPGLTNEVNLIYGKDLGQVEYRILTDALKNEYALTCLDLKSGAWEEVSYYMEIADLIVVVLPQNPKIWRMFYQTYREKLRGKKVYVLIGGYFGDSKYGLAQYKRSFGRTVVGGIGAVPMCVGYLDALAEGKAVEFFLKNTYASKKEENYEFMEFTKKAAKEIKECVFLS